MDFIEMAIDHVLAGPPARIGATVATRDIVLSMELISVGNDYAVLRYKDEEHTVKMNTVFDVSEVCQLAVFLKLQHLTFSSN